MNSQQSRVYLRCSFDVLWLRISSPSKKKLYIYIQVRDVTCICSHSSLSFPSSPPRRTVVLGALFKFNIEMTEYVSGKAQRELAAILTPLPTLAGCYEASEKALKGLETQFKVAQWEGFFSVPWRVSPLRLLAQECVGEWGGAHYALTRNSGMRHEKEKGRADILVPSIY